MNLFENKTNTSNYLLFIYQHSIENDTSSRFLFLSFTHAIMKYGTHKEARWVILITQPFFYVKLSQTRGKSTACCILMISSFLQKNENGLWVNSVHARTYVHGSSFLRNCQKVSEFDRILSRTYHRQCRILVTLFLVLSKKLLDLFVNLKKIKSIFKI